MSVIAHSYNNPYRIWRCPACGNPSGRAGHINAECAAKPVEYVRADTTQGAVEALEKIGGGNSERIRMSAEMAFQVARSALERVGIDPRGGQ